MSIRIIKKGILDTIQDNGRYGYQHLGINPTGVMDIVSMRLVNALVGNDANEAVIEMHWPAPVIKFEKDGCFAISGAAVIAELDKHLTVPLNRTVFVKAGTQLSFQKNQPVHVFTSLFKMVLHQPPGLIAIAHIYNLTRVGNP